MGKRARKKAVKHTQKVSPIWVIRKRLYVYLPVFALLFGIGILQTSLARTPLPEDLIAQAETSRSLSYKYEPNVTEAYFEGKKQVIPSVVKKLLAQDQPQNILGVNTGEERWVEVDLSDQKLTAHDGDQVFLESKVSSGLARTPTPTGEFKVWYKIKSAKMSGGEGRDYYYLPNVPYIMFFENEGVPGYKGYSLHGAYWHNDFGNVRSHGCVNLPIPVAEQLYYWSSPGVDEGKNLARATDDNPGMRIVIHE